MTPLHITCILLSYFCVSQLVWMVNILPSSFTKYLVLVPALGSAAQREGGGSFNSTQPAQPGAAWRRPASGGGSFNSAQLRQAIP